MNTEQAIKFAEFWNDFSWIFGISEPVIIIVVAVVVLHRISGWKKLEEAYPLHMPFTETRYHWQQVNVGGINFNNSMTIGASSYGLYVRPTTPFHLKLFKPILLPWEQIKVEEKNCHKVYKNDRNNSLYDATA